MLSFADLPMELKTQIVKDFLVATAEDVAEQIKRDTAGVRNLDYWYYYARRRFIPLAFASKELLYMTCDLGKKLHDCWLQEVSKPPELGKYPCTNPTVWQMSYKRCTIWRGTAKPKFCENCSTISRLSIQVHRFHNVLEMLKCIQTSLKSGKTTLHCSCGRLLSCANLTTEVGNPWSIPFRRGKDAFFWHGLELVVDKDHLGHRWCGCEKATEKPGTWTISTRGSDPFSPY